MSFNTNVAVASLIVTLIVIPFSIFILDMATFYNNEVPTEYQEIFTDYQSVKDLNELQQNSIESGEINSNGFEESSFTNSIIVSKQMQSSSNLFFTYINSLPKIIAIPINVIFILLAIIVTLSIASFVQSILKVKP